MQRIVEHKDQIENAEAKSEIQKCIAKQLKVIELIGSIYSFTSYLEKVQRSFPKMIDPNSSKGAYENLPLNEEAVNAAIRIGELYEELLTVVNEAE